MTDAVKLPGMKTIESMTINGKVLKDYSHKDCMRLIWLAAQELDGLRRSNGILSFWLQSIALNYVPVSEQ